MFNTPVRALVAIAVGAVLSLGTTSAAQADEMTTTNAPCAAQEAQVAKARAAALHVNAGKAKDKKAQLQRLAKAEVRLATCLAAQPA